MKRTLLVAVWLTTICLAYFLGKGDSGTNGTLPRDVGDLLAKPADDGSAKLGGARTGSSISSLMKAADSGNLMVRSARLLEVTSSLSKEQVLARLSETLPFRTRDSRNVGVRRALATRLAQLDPIAALEYVEGLPKQADMSVASAVFSELVLHDADKAAVSIKLSKNTRFRAAALGAGVDALTSAGKPDEAFAFLSAAGNPEPAYVTTIMARWATDAPEEAAHYAASKLLGQNRRYSLKAIGQSWAARDSQSAIDWASALTNPQDREFAMVGVLEGYSNVDPANAAQRAMDLSLGETRKTLLKDLSMSWASVDPTSALAWADNIADPEERGHWLHGLSRPLAINEPDIALQTIESLPSGRHKERFVDSFLTAWRLIRPGDAAKFASELPASLVDESALQNIARDWAFEGTEAETKSAAEWALSQAERRPEALRGAMEGWVKQNPVEAANFAAGVERDDLRQSALNWIASAWVEEDYSGAIEWANGLPEKHRDSALVAALQRLSGGRPEAAARHYFDLAATREESGEGESSEAFSKLAPSIVRSLGRDNPRLAVNVAFKLPDDSARAQILGDIARAWAYNDLPAASEWVETLPRGATRDKALESVVSQTLRSDPAAAFQLATTIDDERMRAYHLKSTIKKWSEGDEKAVTEAIAASNLPEPDKVALLKSASKGK